MGGKLIIFGNFFGRPDNLYYAIPRRFSPPLAPLTRAFPPQDWATLHVPSGPSRAAVRIHFFSTFGTVAPFGLVGIYQTRRRWRRFLPLYVVLFGYMGTVLLFFNFSRFRVPIVPILALFASESLLAIGSA